MSRLTLDAAASEAGVSKGGILYHFPSRAALVSAMVERFVVSFDADLDRYGANGGGPGDFTRAYLRATLAPSDGPADERGDNRDQRLGGALLAGVASDPELLTPLRERFDAWQAAVANDGLAEEVATLVRLTSDGLWLSDLFGLAPITGELRKKVGERLFELMDGAHATASGETRGEVTE